MPNLPNKVETRTVDIWRISLGEIKPCESLLSGDEQQRADGFRREIDARRFVASRTALRQILSSYLQLEPQAIVFSYNACGKPSVENSEWNFNLSHCEDVALIAVSQSTPVGVDIEKVSDARAQRMKRLLPPEDVEQDLTVREVCERWVQLEALVKARGEGLSVPMPTMRVLESGYSVQMLDLNDCVAAVAIASETLFNIRWRDYCEFVLL